MDKAAEILFRSFSAEGLCDQFWHGKVCPFFDIVNPALPLLTSELSTFQTALKDDFGEDVLACDMPQPSKFLSLDSCQRRFLWAHKEADLALSPVAGFLLQVEDAKKFPWAVGFKSPDPCLTAIED